MNKTLVESGLLVMLATVSSCTEPPANPANDPAQSTAQSTPETPPTPEPEVTEQPVEPEADDQPAVSFTPCTDPTRTAIEATVVGQVEAFSAGDFDTAYDFASPSFQAGMPREVFGTLIRASYPQLLEATNARSGPCDADEDFGVSTIVMRFDTPQETGYTLRYILELVDDQWRISGAAQEEVADTVA